MAAAPWLWLFGALSALRGIPFAFSNALLHTHSARVLSPDQATAILALAPMPRNMGGLLLPLVAAAVASATGSVGAAIAVGAIGYLGSFLAGVGLGRVTREAKRSVAEESAR
jgi:hypothetical protein